MVSSTADPSQNNVQEFVDAHQRARDIRLGKIADTPERVEQPTDAEVAAYDTAQAAHEQAASLRVNSFNAAAAPHLAAARAAQEAADKVVIQPRIRPDQVWRYANGTEVPAVEWNAAVDTAQRLRDAELAKVTAAQAEVKKLSDADSAKVVKSWNERVATAKKDVPGFAEMLDAPPRFNQAVEGAIVECLHGPAILMALSEDDALAAKIRAMTPAKAIIEIGKLEDSLGRPRARTVKVEASKTTTQQIHESALGKRKADTAAKVAARGTTLSAADAKLFDANGEFVGTPKEWRALRAAGKI
jgi:hypothetical protein